MKKFLGKISIFGFLVISVSIQFFASNCYSEENPSEQAPASQPAEDAKKEEPVAGLPEEYVEPTKKVKTEDFQEELCEEIYGFSTENTEYALCKIRNLTQKFVHQRGSRSQLLFPRTANDAAVETALSNLLNTGSSKLEAKNRPILLENARADAQILAQLLMQQVNDDYEDGGYQTKGNALFNLALTTLGDMVIVNPNSREVVSAVFDALTTITEREFQQSYLNQAFLEGVHRAGTALWISTGALAIIAFATRTKVGLEKITSLQGLFRQRPAIDLMRGWPSLVRGAAKGVRTGSSKLAEYYFQRQQTQTWKALFQQFGEVGGRGAALKGIGKKIRTSDLTKFGLIPIAAGAGVPFLADVILEHVRGPKANPYEIKRAAYGGAALFLLSEVEDAFKTANEFSEKVESDLRDVYDMLDRIRGYSDHSLGVSKTAKNFAKKTLEEYRKQRNELIPLLTQIPEMEESVDELRSQQLIADIRAAGPNGKNVFDEAYEKWTEGRTHVSLSPLHVIGGATLHILSQVREKIEKITNLVTSELGYLEIKKLEKELNEKYGQMGSGKKLLQVYYNFFRSQLKTKKDFTEDEIITIRFLLKDVTDVDLQTIVPSLTVDPEGFKKFVKDYRR